MASVFSSKAADPTITLDLSLEMNKKFQEVLEDTLIKNIRLQENIHILGQEISKLQQDLAQAKGVPLEHVVRPTTSNTSMLSVTSDTATNDTYEESTTNSDFTSSRELLGNENN